MRRPPTPRPVPLVAAFVAILSLAVVGAVVGCASGSPPGSPATTGPTPAAFPVTIGSLTITQRPERIVSLAPTATETLFAVGAGAQVVAADEYSTYPAQAPKTSLSGFKPNAEAITSYRPDLVVISNDQEHIVDQLKTLHIPTFLAPAPDTLDGAYQQIVDLGRLTGHGDEAQAVVIRMRDDIATIVKDLPVRATPLTYYYELDPNLYSVTSATFVGSLLAGLGLVNIADAASPGNPYPQLSAEVIIKADPDLIFLADTVCCGQSAATLAKRAGWGGLKAVRDGRVVALDDDIASRWGPRIVDLLRAAAAGVAAVSAS